MNESTERITTVEPSPFTDRAWYAWLVLVVAIALTATGTVVLHRAITHTDDERFATAVASIEDHVTRRMDTYSAMMRGVSGLFDGATEVNRTTFAAYMQHIDMRHNYPGILGLGWSAPVPAGSESATLAWLVAQGYQQPRLWSNQRSDQRSELQPELGRTAILLLEPDEAGNRRAIGFDMASETTRRLAMLQALTVADIRASGPVTLAQDIGRSGVMGFLVYLPIFAHGSERRLRGYVFAPFRCDDLFSVIFPDAPDTSLTLRVSDAEGDVVMYDTTTTDSAQSSSASTSASHRTIRTISMLGRTWMVDYRSTAAFEQRSSQGLVPLFAGSGLILGFGLFLLARSQVRAVADNAALYRASTRARRAAELNLDINLRLASTLDPQSVAQAVTDAGREVTTATFGAFFTTSVKADDLAAFALSGESTDYFSTHGLPRVTALFAATIAGQEIVRLDDVRIDPRYTPYPEDSTESSGEPLVCSYLAVAVRSRTGEVLGGLLYAHHEPARFSAEHERQLLGLAAQAAIAFDNARLFEAEREAKRIAGHRADDLSQANSELQQFIYVSSHDLQEPLRTITQYLDLLQRRHIAQLDDQARRYVTYASDSASRMYVLLNDLLTYSRLGHGAERTLVELSELVDEVLRDLRLVVAETHAQMAIEQLPAVRCDRAKISSLFQNLIGNALKFRGDAALRIQVSATADVAGVWTITVADNGIGIVPEHREAVFEVFHRLHEREAFPGTGIGLAICRKVVEQHGGRIWIDETPGGGATFRFTLPEDGSGTVPAIRRTGSHQP